MELTFKQISNLPYRVNWDDKVRVGKKCFTIVQANTAWDSACYFKFEKKSNGLQGAIPTLEVSIREPNQNFKKAKPHWVRNPPYHCESIEIPWEVAQMIADFINKGPWIRPDRRRKADA